MRFVAFVILMFLAADASAATSYTGICFLDALLRGLDALSTKVTNAISPTTTTTSTTETTTTSTDTTTTETVYIMRTTTTSTASTTTTTIFQGKCQSNDDCPKTEVAYTCDMDDNIIITTTGYNCFNPGPDSECKGRTSPPRKLTHCIDNMVCLKGIDHCVRL